MTLTELQDEVYTLTNRPDLVTQTLAAIRAATLKLHQMDYFPKDIFETGIIFTPAAYLQTLEFRNIIPRYRAFKYLRKTDSTGTELGAFIDLIDPTNSLDYFNTTRSDVCYLAGQALQIRSSTELQYALFGCYIQPDITVATYDSWIAVDHPYAIVYEAAASVFKSVGDTEQFAAFSQLSAAQMAEVRLSNILAQGY
jgi:hypothetical protein